MCVAMQPTGRRSSFPSASRLQHHSLITASSNRPRFTGPSSKFWVQAANRPPSRSFPSALRRRCASNTASQSRVACSYSAASSGVGVSRNVRGAARMRTCAGHRDERCSHAHAPTSRASQEVCRVAEGHLHDPLQRPQPGRQRRHVRPAAPPQVLIVLPLVHRIARCLAPRRKC